MIRTKIKQITGIIKFPKLWANYFNIQRLHRSSGIEHFKNIHEGSTIFCIGTGPSLLTEQLSLLNDQLLIFTNSSYKLLEKVNPRKKYWFVQDVNRIKELNSVDRNLFDASFRSIPDIENLESSVIHNRDVFIKPEIRFVARGNALVPYTVDSGTSFSFSLEKHISMTGSSVIFSSVQLAAYMGARQIVLLGVDMNYGNSARQAYFDKETMGNRFFWAIPYETTARPAFVEYKKILESNRIKFINCSRGTREDVLDKKALEEIL